ncbi:MAG TPA: TonB-dependent receptor plug domain-containing protein, partial [Steroidobacteraceae bacterium]|nr:TonB-dependent receptor plug domain-containing protein [Steroidobacteraceae bacterium]
MRRSAAGQETVSGWIDGRGGQGGRALSVRGGAARAQVRGVRVEVACLLALLALLAGAGGAWAQTSGQGTAQPTGQGTTQPAGQAPATAGSGSSDVLQEVVVTAERRATDVQSTPIAVTAVSGDQLQTLHLNNISDLQTTVPSFQSNDEAGFFNSINIRGIGNSAITPIIATGVAVFRDGLLMSET